MADTTGTKDATYNLVSVLYHALQGADLYEQYASDAGAIRISPPSSAKLNSKKSSGLTGLSNSWPSVSSRAAKLDRAAAVCSKQS